MNIDSLGETLMYIGMYIPIPIAVLIIIFYKTKTIWKRILIALSFSSAIFVSTMIASLDILFRDGLAPGMVISTGSLALERTSYDFIVAIVAGVLLAAPGVFLVLRKKVNA